MRPVFLMKKQTNKGKKIVILIIALFIIGVLTGVGILKMNRDRMVRAKTKIIPDIIQKLDPSVKLKEVASLKEESGIYVFDLKLDVQGGEQTFTSYMTKDGKFFFTGGIKVADLDKKSEAKTTEEQQKPLTCQDVKKTDTPNLTAFVVADCPYGLQMQRLMKVAALEDPELGPFFAVKYIGSIVNGKITSMHGDKEAAENLRQICIREEQKNLYWPYVYCYMKEGKSPECLLEARVSQTQLETCMSDAQKGLSYAQKDFDEATNLKISGSPTLVANGMIVSEFDFGGRNVDALKQLICCGSNKKLGFCDKTLSKEEIAASYSVVDKGQASGNASANCATQ
jgi:hypothetical protein